MSGVRSWDTLGEGERVVLADRMHLFDPVRFADATTSRAVCGGAGLERGANHLSLWGPDGLRGSLGVVTREVPVRGDAFVTSVCVEASERDAFDHLMRAAIGRVGDPAATIKLALSPLHPHLADFATAHGFAYREDALRLALTGAAPPVAPHPGLVRAPVGADEAETYRAISNEAFRDAPNGGTMTSDEARQRLEGRDFADRVALYRVGEEVVGFHDVELQGAVGMICSLGLLPRFQGRRLGPHLLHGCIDTLRAHGAERVELLVMSSNDRAVRLYRRYGFEQQAVLARWFVRLPGG